MQKPKLADLAQFFGALAVLVGLVLIVVEMRLTSDLTRTQLVSDSYSVYLDEYLALMGENPAAALAKLCITDEPLTAEESVQLYAFSRHILLRGDRLDTIELTGSFGTDSSLLRGWILQELFSTPSGQVLYDNNAQNIKESFGGVAEEFRTPGKGALCTELIDHHDALSQKK